MHTNSSSLSLEDHRRQAGNLVCGFIQKISFSHDFEQQLNFYVDVRANFSNLDQVLSFLIHVRSFIHILVMTVYDKHL